MSIVPSLIDVISKSNPELLDRLRTKFPDERELFSFERSLGDVTEKADFASPKPEERQAILDLISGSIPEVSRRLDSLATRVRATMKRAATIRFVGSLIATVSGGLSGILILVLSNSAIQAVTAFLAMLGGIAAVTADQFERAPSGIRIATSDEYGKIIAMRAGVELMKNQVRRDSIFPLGDSDLKECVKSLDDYSVQIMRLEYS